MLSNLPPGVTGYESHFGPDEQFDDLRFCAGSCDDETVHDIWRYGLLEVRECRICLHETEEYLGPDEF